MSSYLQAPDLRRVNIPRVEKLIAFLESGEHAKGERYLTQSTVTEKYARALLRQGRLPKSTKFCCLGAASEVCMADGVELKRTVYRDGKKAIVSYDGEDAILSEKVEAYYGFPHANPEIQRSDGSWRSAASWNDSGEFQGEIGDSCPEPDFTNIAKGFRRLVEEAKRQQGIA